MTALKYLKNNNPMYSDININENWIQTWQQLDQELYDGVFEIEEAGETSEMNSQDQVQKSNEVEENDNNPSGDDQCDIEERHCILSNDEKRDVIAMEENCKLRDLPYDTCLQSELLEEANQIFSIAPGEGSKPIPLLTDKSFEELSNPDKFPSGKGSYADTNRITRLTLRKYINAQLLDHDGRFAKDIQYIFGMQYAVEHKQV